MSTHCTSPLLVRSSPPHTAPVWAVLLHKYGLNQWEGGSVVCVVCVCCVCVCVCVCVLVIGRRVCMCVYIHMYREEVVFRVPQRQDHCCSIQLQNTAHTLCVH